MWLQQDGSAAGYAIKVRRFLNEAYPDKGICRGEPVNSPPRSPDLIIWASFVGNIY